jgi:hypothetical protein
MKTIWKFELVLDDDPVVEMPEGARVLHADVQYGKPCVWALVDPEAPKTPRRFRLAGSGHPIEDADTRGYINTFLLQDGAFVGHLFDPEAP